MSRTTHSAASPMAEHPLLRALGCIADDLDGVAELDPTYLPTDDKARALIAIQRQLARLEGLRIQVLAAAGDVAEARAARSAGVWLAGESLHEHRTGVRDQRIAERLTAWPDVLAALRDGLMNPRQAEVIADSLEALPDDLEPELLAKAVARLIADAEHFPPHQLRTLGRRVLEVVAPDLADAHEQAALEAEERRARGETRLTFRPRGDGVTEVIARVADHVADRLRTYLDAYTSPRRAHLDDHASSPLGDVDSLPLPRRRGEAFCALLEHIPAQGLPQHGGTATSVVVMIDHDQLVAHVGAAELSTGSQISVSEVRRLACTAGILPAVLGGKGEILDLGRTRRLFSSAQSKALAIRDRRCRAEGCAIPASWCEAHHAGDPWSAGGKTDLADGRLHCSFHHHLAHDPRWRVELLPQGDVRFHRRT